MTLSITCCWLWSKLQLSSGAIKALIGGLSWWSEYQGAGSISESESIVTESLGDSSLPSTATWQNHHRFLGEDQEKCIKYVLVLLNLVVA